jgi:hypothetical protein
LFSHGTPTSSTTKTGRYDIAEILLKMALNIKNKNSNLTYCDMYLPLYVLGKLDLQQVSTSVSYLIYETEKKKIKMENIYLNCRKTNNTAINVQCSRINTIFGY